TGPPPPLPSFPTRPSSDLESNPPPAAVDRVTIRVDVTEGRVLQFGLFARALPTERITTLLARLAALMGSDRVGAPARSLPIKARSEEHTSELQSLAYLVCR